MVILGREEDRRAIKTFLAQYDAPAYIRRARQVEESLEHLLGRCRRQRDEWLAMVRTRIGILGLVAGDWQVLRPWLKDEDQLTVLRELHTALQPRLRV